jgi:hypothetical protein
LAIRSEPVELAPDGGVSLDALVYDPDPSAAVAYSWSWCALLGGADTNYACAMTSEALSSALDPDGGVVINYALGSGSAAVFAYPVSPAVLRSVCAAQPIFPSDAGDFDAGAADGGDADSGTDDGGFSSTLRLPCAGSLNVEVLLTATAGGRQLQSYRTLSMLFTAPSQVNTNPGIDGLEFFASGSDAGLLDGDALQYGQTYALQALVPASASDSYTQGNPAGQGAEDAGGADPDGGTNPADGGPGPDAGRPRPDGGGPEDAGSGQNGESRLEGLGLSWFVSAGTLGNATTNLPPGLAGDGGLDSRDWTALEANTWTAPASPKGGGAGQVQFILVVRDTRAGVGWIRLTRSVSTAGGQP